MFETTKQSGQKTTVAILTFVQFEGNSVATVVF